MVELKQQEEQGGMIELNKLCDMINLT